MEPAEMHSSLEMFLSKAEQPEEFCCGGTFTGHIPGIAVTDFGILGLPLANEKAEALARYCSSKNVDNGKEAAQEKPDLECSSWQLDPSHFKICNPDWHCAIEELVYSKIRTELDLPIFGSITLELNSLFLCKKGGERLPYSDAVKNNHTFAMLVLLLPSIYSGGEIIVTNKEFKETFDYSLESVFKNHYIAFYTNCQRLLKPVKDGNLLALFYNLVLANPTCDIPVTVNMTDIIPDVTKILHHWQMNSDEDAVKHKSLVIVLNHEFSKTGLYWERLKGRDHIISSVMKSAVEKLPIDIYLCLIHFTRNSHCDASGFQEYSANCRFNISSGDSGFGDSCSSVSGESNISLNTRIHDPVSVEDNQLDSDCYLTDLIQINSEKVRLDNIHPNMCDVIPSNSFKLKSPYREVVKASGRVGFVKQKHYRQAALLLLPRKKFCQTIQASSLSEAINLALECAKDLNKVKSDEMQNKCSAAISMCISRIENSIKESGKVHSVNSQDWIKLVKALQLFQNGGLFQCFIAKAIMPHVNILSNDVWFHLVGAISEFGLDPLWPVFQSLTYTGQTPTIKKLLKTLCFNSIGYIPEEIIHLLATSLLGRFLAVEDKNVEEAYTLRCLDDIYRDTIVAVTDLYCMFSTFCYEEWLKQAVNYVRRTPLRHPIEIVVTPAIVNWHRWLMDQTRDSLRNACTYQFAIKQQIQLTEDCIKQLMLVKEPKEPKDSSAISTFVCKCSDCKTVQDFMNNAAQNVLLMQIVQTSYDHLKKCIKLETFGINVKQVDGKNVLDDKLLTLSLTKLNGPDKLRDTYNRCQAAVISLTSLLPLNHPLKFQQKDLAKSPPKKKIKSF